MYSGDFEGSLQRCTSPRYWGVRYGISILPFVARLLQSIKRWFDSRLGTHLINVRMIGSTHPKWHSQSDRLANTEPEYCTIFVTSSGDIKVSCTHKVSVTSDSEQNTLGGDRGASFAAWCIFGTIYALYASAWVRLCPRRARRGVLTPFAGHPHGLVSSPATCLSSIVAFRHPVRWLHTGVYILRFVDLQTLTLVPD